MLGTNNRKFKVLGAAWLVLGGLAFAVALLAIAQVIIDPSAEDGFIQGLVFVLVFAVVGAIGMVNGLALLRRHPVARPLVAISSLVLLIPSAFSLVPLLVVAPSLWLTLSRGGKEAFESYVAKENG